MATSLSFEFEIRSGNCVIATDAFHRVPCSNGAKASVSGAAGGGCDTDDGERLAELRNVLSVQKLKFIVNKLSVPREQPLGLIDCSAKKSIRKEQRKTSSTVSLQIILQRRELTSWLRPPSNIIFLPALTPLIEFEQTHLILNPKVCFPPCEESVKLS
ncbi:unnamed protein product [Hydatigera taeniaeformis]|uniref:DWNN domain-containing protein n=1 Tax=Hydatigena taeniaeformis TaxID=6205 RepID=A0A0R3WZN5_HYDTA|nr:unnamed protein product [Hydatigera taeniaeformis]